MKPLLQKQGKTQNSTFRHVGLCMDVIKPKGKDRIRTQMSAGHSKEDIDFAVKCFAEVKSEMGL